MHTLSQSARAGLRPGLGRAANPVRRVTLSASCPSHLPTATPVLHLPVVTVRRTPDTARTPCLQYLQARPNAAGDSEARVMARQMTPAPHSTTHHHPTRRSVFLL